MAINFDSISANTPMLTAEDIQQFVSNLSAEILDLRTKLESIESKAATIIDISDNSITLQQGVPEE